MSDIKKSSETASDKVVQLPPIDATENEAEEAVKPEETGGGGGWSFEGVGMLIIAILGILVLLYCVGKFIYDSGWNAAVDTNFITRETLPDILAQEFTPGEIERIMYDINNVHYDVVGSLTFHETITIHQRHTKSYHEYTDDYHDIVIDFRYSAWKHTWEISSYTWPNRYTCECEDCPCSCVVPSTI